MTHDRKVTAAALTDNIARMMENCTRRVGMVLSAIWIISAIGGCVDLRKTYVEPQTAGDSVAVLSGTGGCYVVEIDEAKVTSAESINDKGGNQVKLSPGPHRLNVYVSTSHASGLVAFAFTGEAGHVYDFAPDPDLPYHVKVHDRATGQTVPYGS